jgi:hypothetical protein
LSKMMHVLGEREKPSQGAPPTLPTSLAVSVPSEQALASLNPRRYHFELPEPLLFKRPLIRCAVGGQLGAQVQKWSHLGTLKQSALCSGLFGSQLPSLTAQLQQ